MYKLELDIVGRFGLMKLLPAKGNFIDLQLCKEIKDKVNFNSDEMKEYKFEEAEAGGIKWSDSVDSSKEFDFSEMQMDYLKGKVKDTDGASDIEAQFLDLYLQIKLCEKVADASDSKGS